MPHVSSLARRQPVNLPTAQLRKTSVTELQKLIDKERVIFVDLRMASGATTLKEERFGGMDGTLNAELIVRNGRTGLAFAVTKTNANAAPTGGSMGGSFRDERAWLVLDRAGLAHFEKHALRRPVPQRSEAFVRGQFAQTTADAFKVDGRDARVIGGTVFVENPRGGFTQMAMVDGSWGG